MSLWNGVFGNRKTQALQEENGRLVAENADLLKSQNDLRTTCQATSYQLDMARSECEQLVAEERSQSANRVAQLNVTIQKLEASLAAQQQDAKQVEQAHRAVLDLIKSREDRIQELEQQQAHVQSELTHVQSELSIANEWFTRETAKSTERIAELEQKLAATEAHSENRAQQRSALLRNLSEIHRLSSVMSQSEQATRPLKVASTTMSDPETLIRFGAFAESSDSIAQLSSDHIYGEVESA